VIECLRSRLARPSPALLTNPERKHYENPDRRAGGASGIVYPANRIRPVTKDGFMKLYVGNLAYNVSEDQLSDLFSRFGKPDSARVITDRDSGQSKGFGFVEFSDDSAAKAAMTLNGTDFGGRKLTVNEARPKNEGFGGGGGRSRY
jgi:RNA recognition motif-containing protein